MNQSKMWFVPGVGNRVGFFPACWQGWISLFSTIICVGITGAFVPRFIPAPYGSYTGVALIVAEFSLFAWLTRKHRVRVIYKVVSRYEWEIARENYQGSEHDERDGFIHFSIAEQLMRTLNKHFAGQDDLVLVAVDIRRLNNYALKFETSPFYVLHSARNTFPHLYGPLPLSAVRWTKPIEQNKDGFVLPPDINA